MPVLLKILLPMIAGALAGSAAMVGLVYSQTQEPDSNPASEQILTYGDQT